jgi:hypothetical protein
MTHTSTSWRACTRQCARAQATAAPSLTSPCREVTISATSIHTVPWPMRASRWNA